MPRRSRAEIDTPPVRLVAPPCFVGERGQVTLDEPGSPALPGHAGGVVDVLEARPGRVRRVHRRAQRGRGAAVHAPLAARAGRGSLPALRHADDRQGRHPAVLTSVSVARMNHKRVHALEGRAMATSGFCPLSIVHTSLHSGDGTT